MNGITPEDVANKDTTATLGTSDTKYPSQNAVKTYVDTGLASKQASLGFTAENAANKSAASGYQGLDANSLPVKSFVLAQNGIPIILPSSGSIGNNGALTGLTTLPATYANCYMYFPANAISSGSAAGLYYTVMSSATAGTIYNNTYTSGVPAIPGSPTAFSTTGPGAYTQTTASAITLGTVVVTGGVIGAQGRLNIEHLWDVADNTDGKTCTVAVAGNAVMQATINTVSGGYGWGGLCYIWNQGVQNKQVSAYKYNQNGFVGTDGAANTHIAVDTSTNQNVTFTGNLAVATDFIVLDAWTVEVKR